MPPVIEGLRPCLPKTLAQGFSFSTDQKTACFSFLLLSLTHKQSNAYEIAIWCARSSLTILSLCYLTNARDLAKKTRCNSLLFLGRFFHSRTRPILDPRRWPCHAPLCQLDGCTRSKKKRERSGYPNKNRRAFLLPTPQC
ncbi:unnamed protein product [Ectocarpus sp. 6 AP-2014]